MFIGDKTLSVWKAGRRLHNHGMWQEAADSLGIALEHAPSIHRQAHLLSCVAGVYAELGDLDDAENALSRAEVLAEQGGMPATKAVVLLQRAFVAGEVNWIQLRLTIIVSRQLPYYANYPNHLLIWPRALLNLGTAKLNYMIWVVVWQVTRS